jgi:hypothetical protein
LEVGDTAGLETRATKAGGRCLEKSSRFVTILTDSSAEMQRNAEMKERIFNRRQPSQPRLCRTGKDNIFVSFVPFCSSSFCRSAPFVPLSAFI